jgi:hypothetical protein
MNECEFESIMDVLTAGIGRPFTEQQLEVWFGCLRDLTVPVLQTAVKRWLCERASGFPSIAELRRMAAEVEYGSLPTSGEAWERVLDAVRLFGYVRTIEARGMLGELIWRSLGGDGGWDSLCASEEISIQAGQFRRSYEALADRVVTRLALPEDVRPRRMGAMDDAKSEVRKSAAH